MFMHQYTPSIRKEALVNIINMPPPLGIIKTGDIVQNWFSVSNVIWHLSSQNKRNILLGEKG